MPTDAHKAEMTNSFKEAVNFDVVNEGKREMASGGAFGILETLADLKRELNDMKGELKDMKGELKDMKGELKDTREELKEHKEQITDLVKVTGKVKKLRMGELQYWVAVDEAEDRERRGIVTQSSSNINHHHRRERNDAAHGGSILADLSVLSEYLTKYGASPMEPAFSKRYGKPWRAAEQLIDSSDAELTNVFDMRASAHVLFEYDENNRHEDRNSIIQNADKILVAHSAAPMDKRRGMLQPNGSCYNRYDLMRNIHRRVIGWTV